MKTLISLTLFLWGTLIAHAQQPNADEILRAARFVTVLNSNDLKGEIRKSDNGIKAPIALFLRANQGIEFRVWDGKVWNRFQLKLAEDGYDLFEGEGDQIRRFDRKKISEPVLGTDLSYEDLAMSFLYWPNGQVLGEENLGIGRDSYRVRLVNPRAAGRYKTVDVWVHKKSGALMKVNGYQADGKCVKQFEVTRIMRVGGGEYSLKKMKVQSFDQKGRTSGITYLEFDKPEKPKPAGLR